IENWVDRLDVVLSGCSGRGPTQDVCDLLALWAALRRVSPDLLAQVDGLGTWGRADREVQSRGPEWVGLALEVLNPEGWLQEAGQFLADSEDEPDAAILTSRAVALLTDLDEADLVVWVARGLGTSPDPDLEHSLEECAAWLEEHADAFLHAGVFVQAVGLGVRPAPAPAAP